MNNLSCDRQFTNDALENIRLAMGAGDKSREDFFASVDAWSHNDAYTIPCPPIDFREPLSVDVSDAENAIVLYEALLGLDRVNAADPRLWDYLAFTTCRDYMDKRWPVDQIRNWTGRVKARWIFIHPSQGTLIRHGIARLWWLAELTYDRERTHLLSKQTDDAFAYTRWVLKNEDRVLALFDRRIGANTELVFSVVDALQRSDIPDTSESIRDVAKEISLQQSFCRIETLSSAQITDAVNNAIDAIRVQPEIDVGQ